MDSTEEDDARCTECWLPKEREREDDVEKQETHAGRAATVAANTPTPTQSHETLRTRETPEKATRAQPTTTPHTTIYLPVPCIFKKQTPAAALDEPANVVHNRG